jgi:predicted PurR-regulated permease PerM
LKRLAIWALLLGLIYLVRDFFFIAFMTFLFCYATLTIVGWAMQKVAPGQERPRLRGLLTIAVFVLGPLILLGIGLLIGPLLLGQAEHLAGWVSNVSPEVEVSRILEGMVASAEFKSQFGSPGDAAYQKGLDEFRKSGVQYVQEYNEFPSLQAFVEGGFNKQFADQERGRVRARLLHEGTSSKEFEQWFLQDKVPELQKQAREQVPEKGRTSVLIDPLVKAAATAQPEQLLEQARRDSAGLAKLEREWINDTVDQDVATAKQSPAYLEQFRKAYEKRQANSPKAIPYSFEEYIALEKIRPQGALAFGNTLQKMKPRTAEGSDAQLRADFEAAKKHELFQQWWSTNSFAKLVRHYLEDTSASGSSLERIAPMLMKIPLDLSTALLLSFFICIDFPGLQRAARVLRDTWLRDPYDEVVPVFAGLGQLTARALRAQAMVAFCNAVMIFIALTILGVELPVLLSLATFVLCLVPTLGTVIAWGLMAAVALIQPGGGLMLALKVSGAVVIVVFLETFVFSPRIVGKMMELHPVLIMAILPVAQYFFGIWGLILATPVAVYVIHVIILRKGLPGTATVHHAAAVPPPTAPPMAIGAGHTVQSNA